MSPRQVRWNETGRACTLETKILNGRVGNSCGTLHLWCALQKWQINQGLGSSSWARARKTMMGCKVYNYNSRFQVVEAASPELYMAQEEETGSSRSVKKSWGDWVPGSQHSVLKQIAQSEYHFSLIYERQDKRLKWSWSQCTHTGQYAPVSTSQLWQTKLGSTAGGKGGSDEALFLEPFSSRTCGTHASSALCPARSPFMGSGFLIQPNWHFPSEEPLQFSVLLETSSFDVLQG